MKEVSVFLNGKEYKTEEGKSILQVALDNGIEIPHFCFHEDLPMDANCRTCLVELEKNGKVMTSCTLRAEEGLRVLLDTPKVIRIRKKNMELLLAEHDHYCMKCRAGYFCKTAEIMKKYGVTGNEFRRNIVDRSVHKMGSAAEFDPNECIACNKCVEICEEIGVCFLKMDGHDSKTRVWHTEDPKIDCIYCGQCTVHCPVSAVREQYQIEDVERVLKDPEKIVIVQTAPSVRASIGEEFGLPYGEDVTGKLYTAYRLLGFDKVFDVNMGADITTMVEAEELIERLGSKKGLPMFTSCCPGWVKCLEFYYPEFIPNLTTARSPQIHSGGAYKTWWAKREGIDPEKIVIVSVMPCTSKKYEAKHEKLFINGMKPVDYSLTTRELAIMLKKHNIDFPRLNPSEVDREGMYSGAAAIYGASGGVMESALRTAYFLVTGEEYGKIEFHEVRGMKGIKRADITIGDITLKVAVVATAKNFKIIADEIRKDPNAYHYIEVMACPGGCIGGGGQPIPSTYKIIEKRIEGLYAIDRGMKLRTAHQNEVVKEFFEYVDSLPKKERDAILYTTYSQKKKFE